MDSDRITMLEVARKAGVACSTVSKALRDDPTISWKRCAEIKKIAKKLGYKPHPLVAALMSQLHGRRRRDDPINIAWIDLWPQGKGSVAVPYWNEHLLGVRKRAAELGYGIEVYQATTDNISPPRLRQILVSRSQWGIIIPPVPEEAMQYAFDLHGFAAITIGTSLQTPVMHRVCHNHFQGVQLACDQLRGKGYKRIGLVLSSAVNSRVHGKWYGGFLARQLYWPEAQCIRPLLVGPDDQKKLKHWLKTENPDAVIIGESMIGTWLKNISPLPKVVWLTLGSDRQKRWGINQMPEVVGRAAVELMVGQIHRNERGSQMPSRTFLIDGTWVGK